MAPLRDSEFLPEVWALYATGTTALLLRFAVRLRTVGFFGLRLDDGFAFIALGCWTYTIAITHVTYHLGTNTDYTPSEVAEFDQRRIDQVKFISKLFLGSWYTYIALVFSLKGIVIILYQRLTIGVWQEFVLKATIWICVIGCTVVTTALTFICLPVERRWSLPADPKIECTASPQVLIMLSSINAFSDILLLCIPVPLLWTLHIPLVKRVGIFVLLASGLFVLAACITRVSLTAVPNVSFLVIARWGIREFAIALVAVNAASLRPLFRASFWRKSNTSPAAQACHRKNNYIFGSLHRARQHFSRHHITNDILNSTSTGPYTLDSINREQNGQEGNVFDNPNYRVPNPLHTESQTRGAARGGRGFLSSLRSLVTSENGSQGQSEVRTRQTSQGGGEPWGTKANVDLEKGAMFDNVIEKSDSGAPQRVENIHSRTGGEAKGEDIRSDMG